MDTRPIGMFDSGVGGLTVYKEIRKKFPYENIIYLGDTRNFPYGNKSKRNIINLTKHGIDFLISKNVKAIIIACGTASSQALDLIKNSYSIPIIGIIEPTAKYISLNSHLHKIGILATKGTIKSNGWANSLLKYKNDLQIINKACPLLAPMAEEGWINNEIARLSVHEYVKNMYDVDALVLGCTHYPLFIDIFKHEINEKAEIINTGTVIANNLKDILGCNLLDSNVLNIVNSLSINDTSLDYNVYGRSEIYLTDTECNFISVAKKLLNVKSLNVVTI